MKYLLLSINPQYVEQIISGKKYYEFRKFRCRGDVNKMLIYETAPFKRIIGETDIVEIIHDNVLKVWQKTKDGAGVSYDRYMQYYTGKSEAVAYKLDNLVLYYEPLTLADIGVSSAPQSYMYVDM